MVFNCIEYVLRDLESQKRTIKKYQEEKRKLPLGALSASEKKGRKYYTKITFHRGKRRVKYLGGAGHPEVQRLQKRYFLEKAVSAMKKNIDLMENFIRNYQSVDPNQMQKTFPKAYQSLPEACFHTAGVFDLEKWGSQPYVKSTKNPELLTQITTKGDLVRSKSEVIIANALNARGLSYRYEELCNINGYTKAPDFRIIHPKSGRIIYWEHCGLITDYGYLRDTYHRIYDYIRQEIVPGDNLILTFDDAAGNINSFTIERIIELWFFTYP